MLAIQEVPILFNIFNRPSTTKLVFEKIRKLKPVKLYIAADGPRVHNSSDSDLILEARKITESIDWKCTVHRLYRKKNLGCGKAISSAIDWFFKNEECGVILEDDCLIDSSFYGFMRNMLEIYKNDNKVMNISGDNFLPSELQNSNIYHLSKYVHIWGWGTWKRAWKKYDFDMHSWNGKNFFSKFKSVSGGFWEKLYWMSKFDSVGYKITNTWDYQWVYAVMNNNKLSVVPGVNLVSNIGFGNDSTHTTDSNYYLSNLKTSEIKKDIILASDNSSQKLNEYERIQIFKTNSLTTLIHFAYFSIFCMIYNRLKANNHAK